MSHKLKTSEEHRKICQKILYFYVFRRKITEFCKQRRNSQLIVQLLQHAAGHGATTGIVSIFLRICFYVRFFSHFHAQKIISLQIAALPVGSPVRQTKKRSEKLNGFHFFFLIGSEERAKIYFSLLNSLFYPAKYTAMPDQIIIILVRFKI